MKKYFILAMIAVSGMFLNAQENASERQFYYYKGEKVYQTVDYSRISVVSEGRFDAENVRKSVGIPAFEIENSEKSFTRQNVVPMDETARLMQARDFFVTEVEFPSALSRSDYYAVMEQFSKEDNVVRVMPTHLISSGKKQGLSNYFYVKLFNEGDRNTLFALAEQYTIEVIGYNEFMPLWFTLSCNKESSLGVMEAANVFYETGLFASTEPEFLYHDLLASPDDPYYPNQWALNNTGQICSATGIDIGAESAWDITTGSPDIRVAVFDHGIQMNHPDLINNIYGTGYDATSNTTPAVIWGDHGTACAGIVAAQQNNGIGVSGVAPDAQLMSISVKLLLSDTPQQLANGFNWAWQNGADVISNSWGGYDPSNIITDAITATLTEGRDGKGTVVVFAAGNNNNANIIYPGGAIPEIIVVGAMSPNGERKSTSSCDGEYWWGSCYGTQLDVMAPGVKIYTTDRTGGAGYAPGDYEPEFNGTSSACPHVAGVAALILSINPELTVQEVTDIIESTAKKVGTYDYQTTAGRPNGTWHNQMGYGLVDAAAAVMATPSLVLSVHEAIINDADGNNNGNANPGETIKINLSLINNSDQPANDVNVTITSTNEYVTIIADNASFGAIAAGEIKTVEDAFTIEISPLAPAKNKMAFKAMINTAADSFNGAFNITCFDYALNLTKTVIDDAAGNGDGILNPGETADILPTITNKGNEPAMGLTGFLTSSSSDITINSNTADYGDMDIDQTNVASYNVTLSASAVPGSVNIPFNLLVTDEDGRKSTFNFAYIDKCTVVFDLYDSYGDGWTGNILHVAFSDGSPTQNLTINGNNSFATYSLAINAGVTVSLSWTTGSYPGDCSFEIYYLDGDPIYSASNPNSGLSFSWVVNCGGSAVNCDPITDLAITIDNDTAELTWNAPVGGTPTHYEIYHNLESLGTTTETHFSATVNNGDNEFCVYAVFDDCLMPQCITANTAPIECDPPTDLVYTVGYAGLVTVSWTKPGDDTNLVGYNVYLDEVFVEMVTEETYTFVGEEMDYNFCVSALHVIDGFDCESEKICETIGVTVHCDVTVELTLDADFHLSWLPVVENASYNIYRNAEFLTNVEENSYTDTDIKIHTLYCYTVTVLCAEDLESEPSNEECDIIIGIAEMDNQVKIYPNPTNGELRVESGELRIEGVEILDVFGRLTTPNPSKSKGGEFGAGSAMTMDISYLPAGVYFLRITTENGVIVRKVMKE
ncbi:MAG: S8 family serine peptidase [Bacteroidales bacterium]|nr:S8 family serine peptidase [Bacteroidales bacterium]